MLLHHFGLPTGERPNDRGFVPDSLRSGGCTHRFEFNKRDISLTAWDLKVDSTKTLEHYLQEAPAHNVWSRLSFDQRRKLSTLGGACAELIHQATTLLELGVATSRWPSVLASGVLNH